MRNDRIPVPYSLSHQFNFGLNHMKADIILRWNSFRHSPQTSFEWLFLNNKHLDTEEFSNPTLKVYLFWRGRSKNDLTISTRWSSFIWEAKFVHSNCAPLLYSSRRMPRVFCNKHSKCSSWMSSHWTCSNVSCNSLVEEEEKTRILLEPRTELHIALWYHIVSGGKHLWLSSYWLTVHVLNLENILEKELDVPFIQTNKNWTQKPHHVPWFTSVLDFTFLKFNSSKKNYHKFPQTIQLINALYKIK